MSFLDFKKKNVFDLTHEVKLTCNMGDLVPFMCEEVVPGDTFKVTSDLVLRLIPMLAPIMHRVDVFTHFWYVPTRLVHDNFEKFITGGSDGKDNTVVPTISAPNGGFAEGSLADFLNIPTGVSNIEVLAYPFRAYNLIWNEWYRDENLQSEVANSTSDGVDSTSNTTLLKRAWQKDYFTNALPWAQKGDPVNLPLGTVAPVVSDGTIPNFSSKNTTDGAFTNQNLRTKQATLTSNKFRWMTAGDQNSGSDISRDTIFGSNTGLKADLTNATSATINSIRQAFQLQKWFEINAIAGSRYVESILAHFGVRTGDARLQRPEFLGGGRSPILVSEVVQQSASVQNGSPQGNMAGHGFTANRSHSFTHFFPEHGYVIGILSIMPKPSYQQGLRRMYQRRSRLDFYWPVFSHLGNQEIKNSELFCQGSNVVDSNGEIVDEKPFGYTGRYDEYRYIPSTVHGYFKSSYNYWHLGRIFNNLPTLNSGFIECNPAKRPFAVQNTDVCLVEILNQVTAVRRMPKKAYPGLIDHA